MFVKILEIDIDENENYPVKKIKGYECDTYDIYDSDRDEASGIIVEIYKNDIRKFVAWYPKWKVNIYITNNDGKTIDRYEWRGCNPPKKERR